VPKALIAEWSKTIHIVLFHRILEYLSRDDADRAVKDLDGKDLRGRPVRVALDDTVRVIDYYSTG
jgi:hypothetical protein